MFDWLGKLFRRTPEPEPEPTPEVEALPEVERTGDRAHSFMEAIIITQNAYRKKGVAVDMSETGARLRFHSTEGLTEIVQVKIPLAKVDRSARVVWKDGTDVGVQYELES